MVASSFTARRSKPELVTPARAMPRETKPLSDLDDSRNLCFLEPYVEFFSPSSSQIVVCDDRPAPEEKKRDPAAALAEALVHYYPIARRMRELEKGKLVVDCTGEGVLTVRNIPPCINTLSEEFSRAKDDDIMWTTPTESMVCEYFTFSSSNIAALRRLVPAKITNVVTSFELLTVAMWRSRTVALGY
uniref:Uncharacterized protein n=1 Tax=Leersia perrieri TaxID=77586 RepID=A0A0D9XYP1_9ORYZ